VQRLVGGSPSCARQAAQAQDDGQRIEAAGRCESERDGGGEVASDAARERWSCCPCMLCGRDGPGTQQASAALCRCSSAPDDGFRPCVLCGGARESQRASARAHEVRALWRLPQSSVQHAFTEMLAGTVDEVARASSPCPSTPPPPSAPADQAGRGRDAHRRRATRSDEADARQAGRLEAAKGTVAVLAAMTARRKANAASAQPPEASNKRICPAVP
jgi:hypothetical protein